MPESNPAPILTSRVISSQQPNLSVPQSFLGTNSARVLEDRVSSLCQLSARHALSTDIQASLAAVVAEDSAPLAVYYLHAHILCYTERNASSCFSPRP